MKLFVVACLLATTLPLLCSAASSYSSFWEYLLEQEQTLKSFKAGKIWSDCSKSNCSCQTNSLSYDTNCTAKPSDHGKIIDIQLSPNPPKRGSDLIVNATVSIGKAV